MNVGGDQQCKEEEIPTDISSNASSYGSTPGRCPSSRYSQDYTEEADQSNVSDAGPSSKRAPGVATRRRHNFTDAELEVLVEQVIVQFHTEVRRVTGPERAEKWAEITRKVNEKSMFQRKTNEVQKRWSDYKLRLKGRIRKLHQHARVTGGGPPLEARLTPIEERASVAISMGEIFPVGDIDTGYSPPHVGQISPLEREYQAAGEEEAARDVEESQWVQAELARVQALSLASQRLGAATESMDTHVAQIASTLPRMEHQLTTFISTFTTQMSTLNSTLTNIATLLGDLLHAHSQRTSDTLPSPISADPFPSPLPAHALAPLPAQDPAPSQRRAQSAALVSSDAFSEPSTSRVTRSQVHPVMGPIAPEKMKY